MTRTLILLLLCACMQHASAQTYVRTSKNFGLFAAYSPANMTQRPGSFRTVNNGQALSAGLTRQVWQIVYPELFYLRHQGFTPYSDENNTPVPYRWNGIGAGLAVKLDLFAFDVRKKNGYCFGRMVNLIAGGDYVHPVAVTATPFESKAQGEATARLGLGMYSVWGGSSRAKKSWTIHWEATYRYGLTPFMTAIDRPAPGMNDAWTHSSVNLTLRVIRHKVYKFSDM